MMSNLITEIHARQDIRGLALRRLYELSPNEGRRFILAEIRSPRPRVPVNALRNLPDKTLPGVEKALAAHFEKILIDGKLDEGLADYKREDYDTTETLSLLIERYATRSVFSRVKSAYTIDPQLPSSQI